MKNIMIVMAGMLVSCAPLISKTNAAEKYSKHGQTSRIIDMLGEFCAENQWRGTIDTVLLGRNQKFYGNLVIQSGSPDSVAMSGSNLNFDSATGIRTTFIRDLGGSRSLQISYFDMGDWDSEAFALGLNNLNLPGDLGSLPDFSLTDAFQAQHSSDMRSFEANVTQQNGGMYWLAGFRHMRINEAFKLTSFDLDTFQGAYSVNTVNSLYGAQIGMQCQRQSGNVVISVLAKTGVYGNEAKQTSLVQTANGALTYRSKMFTDNTVSNISEITINGDIKLTEIIAFRIGFDLLWASDLALAPNQLDFSDTPTSSDFVDTSGSMFMQGAHIGLMVNF